MALSSDDRHRRLFMRRALGLLPLAGVAGALVSQRAEAGQGDDRSEALDIVARNNVLYWGADPSGRRDSAPAFARAARSNVITSLYVPPGRYAIGTTVDLRGKNLVGPGRQRFRNEAHASLIPFHSLAESAPMITGHGPVVRDLNFSTGDRSWKGTFIDSHGYNTVIENVHFINAAHGLRVREIMVNYSVVRCTFIGLETAIRVDDESGEFSTTARFVGNEFQHGENAIVFERDLHGATFQDNIFEALQGDGVRARLIYTSSFIGNWWEGRNGGESPWPAVRTTQGQQFMNCFAATNTCTWGWEDVFSKEVHSGSMGGVSTNGGDVLVRDSTGNALRLGTSSLRAETDSWKPLTPLVIQASHSAGSQHTHPLVFRHSGRGGAVIFDTDESAGINRVWDGRLRFASQSDDEGELHYDDYRINRRRPGILGRTSLIDETGTLRHALTGVPQFVRWREGGGPGCDFFSRFEAIEAGVVEFSFPDGEVTLKDPIITVTVDEPGVVHDGIDYLPAHEGAEREHLWRGFRVRFSSRDRGRPTTPESFNLAIFYPSLD